MSADDDDRAFFGHPRGLSTLFFTEMWERLSYYGARAFLVIYMTKPVALGGRAMPDGNAATVMALYLSTVYLLSLPGGWIADRFLGQRKSVTIGGIGITLGNAMLAIPGGALFYPGLVIICLGTGFLKPNVSTIVGQLYKPDDIRRDAGFTVYYMGINIGAGAAPLVGMLHRAERELPALLAGPRHGSEPVLEHRVRRRRGRHGVRRRAVPRRLQEARRGRHCTRRSRPIRNARTRSLGARSASWSGSSRWSAAPSRSIGSSRRSATR